VGSEKRERQKTARIAKIEAAEREARRARTRRRAIQLAVAAVVILGGLLLYSLLFADDDDETAANGDTTTTTAPCPPETAPVSTSVPYPNPELATEVLERDAPCPEPPPEDTAPDAVETETLIEGEGEEAAEGDTVVVHYIGRVADGTVFDQSWSQSRVLDVTLGTGGVIPGWEEGLVGARVGERRRLVIGSEKAYGAQGSPPAIPPDAPLAFEVDVVAVIPAGAAPPAPAPGAPAAGAPAPQAPAPGAPAPPAPAPPTPAPQ
jgi:hypothetical protein